MRPMLHLLAITALSVAAGLAIMNWTVLSGPIVCGVMGINIGMTYSTWRLHRLYQQPREAEAVLARSARMLGDMSKTLADMTQSAAQPCPSCGFCQNCGKFHEERAVHASSLARYDWEILCGEYRAIASTPVVTRSVRT